MGLWVERFITHPSLNQNAKDPTYINTLRPRQNGPHFADDSFKWIFLNENVRISIEVSLNFVPKDPINNIQAFVQTLAWHRPGDLVLILWL